MPAKGHNLRAAVGNIGSKKAHDYQREITSKLTRGTNGHLSEGESILARKGTWHL